MTKNIFTTLAIVITSFISFNSFAQLDNNLGGSNKGNSSLGSFDTDAIEVTKPKSLGFDNNDGFKTAAQKLKKEQEKKQAEENLKNKGILTKAKIAEERYLKSFQKINGLYNYPVIDQDLGSIRTNSKNINIICRDYQYPDGDRVTIYVNDEPVVVNLTLKQNYQSFSLPLDIGINKIKIVALNQGSSGPNTAAFKIYNDAGTLISSNEWNLATGAKATMIVAKDK